MVIENQYEQRKRQETWEALADVDAGRTTSADAVRAWIDRWDTNDETLAPDHVEPAEGKGRLRR